MCEVVIKICIYTDVFEYDDIHYTETKHILKKIKSGLNDKDINKKIIKTIFPNQTIHKIKKLRLDRFFHINDYEMCLNYFIKIENVKAEFDIWPSWKIAFENNFHGYTVLKEHNYKVSFLAFKEFKKARLSPASFCLE